MRLLQEVDMPRAIWKGAISFGLVHVPVALYPASSDTGIDFDWLDKRSMDPVGYKRVNKLTDKEVDRANIVKGVKVDGGDYVVFNDDEIKAAYPKITQTIEIESWLTSPNCWRRARTSTSPRPRRAQPKPPQPKK